MLFTVTDNGTPPASDSRRSRSLVPNVNRPPTLNPIGNKAGNEGALLEFTLAATDPDGDALTYAASNLPAGAIFNPATQAFSWTPGYDQTGNYSVLFTVTDNGTPPASDSEEITITVGNVNRPPTLNPIGNKAGNEGALLEFTLAATDPDGDALTYAASNLPAGAIFNPATQAFSWTPGYGQAGSYTGIHFETTDGNLVDSEDITITVNASPPGTVSAFSAFSVSPLRINQRLKSFFLLSTFTLGPTSNGINFNPVSDKVTLRIANFTTTIPAGAFRKGAKGVYAFAGKINNILIEALLAPLGNNRFGFQAAAYGANLGVINNPVTVELTIGDDDSGMILVNAIIR
ncbi:MAG: putative Ig domain-containing protein [Candidatus Competibacteraceae bacterium]